MACFHEFKEKFRGRRDRLRILVGYTTTCANS
jgi:hypothetical protein